MSSIQKRIVDLLNTRPDINLQTDSITEKDIYILQSIRLLLVPGHTGWPVYTWSCVSGTL